MFRRNFTFGFAMPATRGDGASWAGDGKPPTTWQSSGNQPDDADGDMTAIACAVNTFKQSEVYDYQYNGYCWNGRTRDGTGFGPQNSYSKCTIDLGPSTGGLQKRAIAEYNGWKVYGEFSVTLLRHCEETFADDNGQVSRYSRTTPTKSFYQRITCFLRASCSPVAERIKSSDVPVLLADGSFRQSDVSFSYTCIP